MQDFKDLHGNSIERLKFSVIALIWLKGKDRNVIGCNDEKNPVHGDFIIGEIKFYHLMHSQALSPRLCEMGHQ